MLRGVNQSVVCIDHIKMAESKNTATANWLVIVDPKFFKEIGISQVISKISMPIIKKIKLYLKASPFLNRFSSLVSVWSLPIKLCGRLFYVLCHAHIHYSRQEARQQV